MATCTLDARPIARVYGTVNLYKDVKNIDNANHLEQELSRLEGVAANVIKTIHNCLGRGEFKIERKALESLRKFLFIMFYRKAALSSSYYDENHPENAPLVKWIERVKAKYALTNQVEVWLHFLQHFLNTPHTDLMDRAQGAADFASTNSAMDDYPAIDYASISGMFFLGVVEAADDAEFIISSNSSGLWEGRLLGEPAVHRVFVVSPRVALLLRNNICRPEFAGSMSSYVDSSLANIGLEPPQVEYPGGRQRYTPDEMKRHRLSSAAQHDLYRFRVVKLTKAQTQEVNNVVLLNVKEMGSLTFRTKSLMLKTLQSYNGTPYKNKYAALMTELIHIRDNPSLSSGSGPSNKAQPNSSAQPATGNDSKRFNHSPDMFPVSQGAYNRAYRVFSDASTDKLEGRYVFDTTDYLVERFRNFQLPEIVKSSQGGTRIRTDPFAQLVEALPETDGAVVMATMKGLLSELDVKKWGDPTVGEGLYEAAIVGLLDWLVKNRGDVLRSLFPDIALIKFD